MKCTRTSDVSGHSLRIGRAARRCITNAASDGSSVAGKKTEKVAEMAMLEVDATSIMLGKVPS